MTKSRSYHALNRSPFSPRDADAYLSISEPSLSRLISAKKIEARKDGTLVDVAPLTATTGAHADTTSPVLR
jgi:hypothetical protein